MTTNRTVQDLWDDIAALVAWLDAKNGRDPHEITLRVGKIAEEFGEVWQALAGSLGQNPRKGRTHTTGDVAAELCDVIVTAAVALATITGPEQAGVHLDSKIAALMARAGLTTVEVHP